MNESRFDVACPTCRQSVPMDDLNVSKDVALCRGCGKVFSFLDGVLPANASPSEIDPNNLPRGVYYRDTFDGFVIGATTRSAFVGCLIPFFLVWGGGSLGGIYVTQIVKGHFDPAQSLFGLPFLAGSLAMLAAILMMLFGRSEVRVDGGEGRAFSGVGPIGWSERFDWDAVRGVEESVDRWNRNGQPSRIVRLLLPERTVTLGSLLSEPKRYGMVQLLRREWRRRETRKPPKPSDDSLSP